MRTHMYFCAFLVLLLSACSSNPKSQRTKSGLNPEKFDSIIDGKQTGLYSITNNSDVEVCFTNYGARILSILVPDKNGDMKDIVLNYDNLNSLTTEASDYGASIGRYANRIKEGILVVDGDTIQLPQNNFGHCLHGGIKGWQYQVYNLVNQTPNSLTFSYLSVDGEENFPGNVEAFVTYTLTDNNSLEIDYEATTDQKTVINMTNHSYFNLTGNPLTPITDHNLYVNADNYTPIDETVITTGEILSLKDTPLDFTVERKIGSRIDEYNFDQLKFADGIDHNFVLNTQGDDTQLAARIYSEETGIGVEVYTNEPGIQVYTGNFMDGSAIGKKGLAYNKRTGVCLETQHYPDSPNKSDWPSVYLSPGETYKSKCTYKFTLTK